MTEYINREEAIKAIMGEPPSLHYPSWYAEAVKGVPAAAVRENTHGHWIEDRRGYCRCSECGYEVNHPIKTTPFCPCCKANMEPYPEEETDGTLSEFGSRVTKLLEKKGITQRELAEMIGVTEVAMTRYIKGDKFPTNPIIDNIAKALDTTAWHLIGGIGKKKTIDKKLTMHKAICDGIHDLYARKNHDYGDSFGQSFRDHGILAGVIRIEDKFNRLRTLAGGTEQMVKDESIKDTLRDMANYAIMTLLEMEVHDGNGYEE